MAQITSCLQTRVSVGLKFEVVASDNFNDIIVPDRCGPERIMFRWVFLFWVLIASSGFSQTVSLNRTDQARLNNNERIRVLIRLNDVHPTSDLEQNATRFEQAFDEIFREELNQENDGGLSSGSARNVEVFRRLTTAPIVAAYLAREEIDALQTNSRIEWIRTDELYRPTLNNSVARIGASILHGADVRGSGRDIAIIDTGVDLDHPMLAGRTRASACFSSTVVDQSESFCPNGQNIDTTSADAGDNCETLNADPNSGADGCFHGTHVAGIAIGSEFRTGISDVVGVAPEAGLVAVQVFSRFISPEVCGSESPCAIAYSSDVAAGLEWVYENRHQFDLSAINLSLGGDGAQRTACNGHPLRQIVRNLRLEGIATVIASGNDGYSIAVSSPACIEEAITVGASRENVALPATFSNTSIQVDLLAPGVEILSAVPLNPNSGSPELDTSSGTSMAAPHVAGAIALLQSAFPEVDLDAIEMALVSTGISSDLNGAYPPEIRVYSAFQMLAALQSAPFNSIRVSPLDAYETRGRASAPASFSTRDYAIENVSQAGVGWSATSQAQWLGLAVGPTLGGLPTSFSAFSSSANGFLVPGETVVLRLGIRHENLTPGTYRSVATVGPTGIESLSIPAQLELLNPSAANDYFATPLAFDDFVREDGFGSDLSQSTTEGGEPDHASMGYDGSVWYRFTFPQSRRITLLGQADLMTQPRSEEQDVALAVYTGDEIFDLDEVISATSDVQNGLDQAEVTFEAMANVSYHVALASQSRPDDLSGGIFLEYETGPPNNSRETAIELTGPTGQYRSSGHGARSAALYQWTAPQTGNVLFSLSFPSGFSHSFAISTFDNGIHEDIAGQYGVLTGPIEAPFHAQEGRTYFIEVAPNFVSGGYTFINWWPERNIGNGLRAAVLPSARGGLIGNRVTAFATLVNPISRGIDATNCRIQQPLNLTSGIEFQTTNPATNEIVGSPNQPVDIPSGGAQSFVFSVPLISTSTSGLETTYEIPFVCDEGVAYGDVLARFSTAAFPTDGPDIISIAATPSRPGRIEIEDGRAGAFSVAAVNLGVRSVIEVRPIRFAYRPDLLEVCETNSNTGQCISSRTSSGLETVFEQGEVKTFSVFMRHNENDEVRFDPTNNRVGLDFLIAEGEEHEGARVSRTTVAHSSTPAN